MKKITKHILLLALMLFGVAGAAWALPERAPQKWTTQVAIADLVEGDTLMEGFSITCSSGETLNFHGNRLKVNNSLRGNNMGIACSEFASITYGPNASLIYSGSIPITPVDANGQDGNAWLVTSVAGSSVYVDGIYVPDPYEPVQDVAGNWNFLMPGANKVVKAVLYDSIVLGPHVSVAVQPVQDFISYTRPGIGGDSTVLYYDPTLANSSFGFIANDDDGQGRNFAFWADDQNNHNTDRDFGGFSELTCGQRFVAVYPDNHTLTLAKEGYGTVELDGESVDTVYTIVFDHASSQEGSRSFTVSSLPYDTTFSYYDYIDNASVNEPSGKLSIINPGNYTVPIRISGTFGNGFYRCRFDGMDDPDEWLISCEASTVPVTPYGITKTGDNTYSVMEGLTLSVTATPERGCRLAQWSDQTEPVEGDARLGGSHSYTMPATDATLTATFVQNPTLILASNNSEWGTVTLDGVTPGATTYNIIIEGGNTYTNVTFPFQTTVFLHEDLTEVWTEQDPLSVERDGNNARITINGPYGGGTVYYSYGQGEGGHKAIFCDAVEGLPIMPEGVTYAGYDTYLVLPGTEVTLTTEAVPLYHLDRWTNQAGTEVASVTPLTVTVTSDTTLVAVFERNMRILHGVPEGWTVMADGVAVAVSADSAVVPAGARVMMIPPVPVKPTVKSFEVEKYIHPNEVPLTMEALTDGTIKVTEPKDGMRYAVNGGDKTDMSGTTQIDVTAGDKVAFYGNGTLIASYDGTKIAGGTAEVKVYGNIMSLVDEENFATAITLTGTRNFRQLFYENYKLKDASGLLLPATTLTERCYDQMFTNDTILTAAPALPATTLAPNCYRSMFSYCHALTTAPALPATTLESNCYNNMFYDCTGLTTAPALPATTLAEFCYNYMFYGCTGLTTAPALPATTLADYCYCYMFANCPGLTTAPALPATTLANNCYYYMFANDTNLTTAPSILPATTLSPYCYQRMFHNCTRLTTAPKLPATTLAIYCYYYMFYGCASLTTAPELPATTLVQNCYANMFQDCSNLRSVTCMATSGINSNNSTIKWLSNTADTGIFVANNAAEWPSGTSGIPEGWNVIDYASPMALNALTDGTIKVVSPKEGMQYSLNGGAKTVMNGNTEIQVTTGDKVAFYGNGTSINKYQGTIFAGTAQVKATGNIMSLVNEEHFDTATVLTGTQAFANLFMYDTNLVDASGLLMPATTLTWGCYLAMFSDCSNLTGAPKLPATTLKPSAYGNMFSGCTSLTTVPDLPATTLAENCYANMFLGCTGLTTAPEIAATTLAVTCCAAMFQNCTSLTKAPSILPATTVASGCYRNMFRGCTSLTATPVLPVESVDKSCYERMFFGCSSLNTVTCLAKTSTGFFNTYEWLSGVAATGTFITPSTTEWDENVPSGIPAGWTRVDAE